MTEAALIPAPPQTHGQRVMAVVRRAERDPEATVHALAMAAGVSHTLVYEMRTLVKRGVLDLVAAVEQGDLSPKTAWRLWQEFQNPTERAQKLAYLLEHRGRAVAIQEVFGTSRTGKRIFHRPSPAAGADLMTRALDQVEVAMDAMEEHLQRTPTVAPDQAHAWLAALTKRRAQARRLTTHLRTKGGCVTHE